MNEPERVELVKLFKQYVIDVVEDVGMQCGAADYLVDQYTDLPNGFIPLLCIYNKCLSAKVRCTLIEGRIHLFCIRATRDRTHTRTQLLNLGDPDFLKKFKEALLALGVPNYV